MGACGSKIKFKRRKDYKAYVVSPEVHNEANYRNVAVSHDEETSRNSVILYDGDSSRNSVVLYEDIDNYEPENQNALANENNVNVDPVRSFTAVSRDSAYFDGNCASVNTSVASLLSHASDASDNHRNKYLRQQSTISENDYVTYETLPGRDEDLFQTSLPSHNTDETDCASAKNRLKRSPVSDYDIYLDMPIPRKAGKDFPEGCECCTNNKLCPEMIPYMIEVFLPLLQECIRVLEVIPHLPFIEDTETFRNKDRDSPRQAVVYLIERVRESEEPGKWQALLEALSTGGYKYICDLLKGETEKDLTNHRKLLRLFTPRLVNRIEPQEFVDHLYEKNVIGEADMEEIRCEERNRGPIAASLMLLELVPRKNPDWYDIFVDVLKKCGLEDMVDDFHIPEKQEHASCTTAYVRTRDTCSNLNQKPVRPFSLPESARRLNVDGLHVQDNRRPDNRRPEADRDYITPTYHNDDNPELPPRLPPRQRSPAGRRQVVVRPRKPSVGMVTENNSEDDHYTRPYANSTELSRLKTLKESLEKELSDTRMKNQLKREVERLQKELHLLQNDYGSEEHNEDVQEASSLHLPNTDTVNNNTVNNNTTGVDDEQKHHVFKDSETQTNDSDVTLCQVLQRVEDISLNLAKLREEMLTEIQKMKTNQTHETKVNEPTYSLANSYDIFKLDKNSLPVPHLRRTGSLVDSGAFSDYVSTASEYYV